MLKYAVKEDYESARTEINMLPITLEYIKPEFKQKKGRGSRSHLPQVMKANSKKRKKMEHLKHK